MIEKNFHGHLKARDGWIGWTAEQRRRRLPLVVNNARLLVWPGRPCANLVGRFMKLMLARLSADWERQWKHPVALAETFVDPHSPPRPPLRQKSRLVEVTAMKRRVLPSILPHDDLHLQKDAG